MRIHSQTSQSGFPCTSRLIVLAVVILFGCLSQVVAQQKDGDTTNADSNSAPSGRVNLSTLQMFNGEYLEMFGAGTSRGILRGHPSISAIELGSLSADPLIFSTNSLERMRILANGFVGIGTSNPINPFEVYFADAATYSPATTSPARVRFINTNTTLNNVFEIDLGAYDSAGNIATGVRLAAIFTNKTPGQMSGDLAIGARHLGPFVELARFTSGGNVGIGTATPAHKLDVAGAIRSSSGGFVFPDGTVQTTASGGSGSQWTTSGANIYYNTGNVGLGTQSPTSRLHVNGGTIRLASTAGEAPFQLYSYANSHSLWLTSAHPNTSEIYLSPGYAVDFDRALGLQYTPGTTGAAGGILRIGQFLKNAATFTHGATALHTNGVERLRINPAGNVGIGTAVPSYRLDVQGGQINASGGLCINGDCRTAWSENNSSQWTTSGANIYYNSGNVGVGTVSPTSKLHVAGDGRFTGNVTVDGNIAAKYQDVAEWVPAATQIAPGTVVVLDSTKPNQVISSNKSYDTRVAGVISAQPGIMLGEQSDNKVLVATTGRVRVKVDATDGPIEIGDLLVTSTREGFAMKSMPVQIAGSQLHRPGTLIGKALESLPRGTGEILVLLSLQ